MVRSSPEARKTIKQNAAVAYIGYAVSLSRCPWQVHHAHPTLASTTSRSWCDRMIPDHKLSEARRRDLKATIEINAPLNSVPIAKYYGFAERLKAQCVHHLRMDAGALPSGRELDVGYVYLKRYAILITEKIPVHNYYKSPNFAKEKEALKKSIPWCVEWLDLVATRMDAEEAAKAEAARAEAAEAEAARKRAEDEASLKRRMDALTGAAREPPPAPAAAGGRPPRARGAVAAGAAVGAADGRAGRREPLPVGRPVPVGAPHLGAARRAARGRAARVRRRRRRRRAAASARRRRRAAVPGRRRPLAHVARALGGRARVVRPKPPARRRRPARESARRSSRARREWEGLLRGGPRAHRVPLHLPGEASPRPRGGGTRAEGGRAGGGGGGGGRKRRRTVRGAFRARARALTRARAPALSLSLGAAARGARRARRAAPPAAAAPAARAATRRTGAPSSRRSSRTSTSRATPRRTGAA